MSRSARKKKASACEVLQADAMWKLKDSDKREIGDEAVWRLSTSKPGNGVQQLRDDDSDTFWQSDGQQPHLVTMQFHKKMKIKELSIYTDFNLDESYTPNKISIRAGTTTEDLMEIKVFGLNEPVGWVPIKLSPHRMQGKGETYLRTNVIQIAVLSSHQNGRDTHIRQVKVYAPREQFSPLTLPEFGEFSSPTFKAMEFIR